jgi:hypothetical protein
MHGPTAISRILLLEKIYAWTLAIALILLLEKICAWTLAIARIFLWGVERDKFLNVDNGGKKMENMAGTLRAKKKEKYISVFGTASPHTDKKFCDWHY